MRGGGATDNKIPSSTSTMSAVDWETKNIRDCVKSTQLLYKITNSDLNLPKSTNYSLLKI